MSNSEQRVSQKCIIRAIIGFIQLLNKNLVRDVLGSCMKKRFDSDRLESLLRQLVITEVWSYVLSWAYMLAFTLPYWEMTSGWDLAGDCTSKKMNFNVGRSSHPVTIHN